MNHCVGKLGRAVAGLGKTQRSSANGDLVSSVTVEKKSPALPGMIGGFY
jgi:hypothetical protein